MATRLSSYYFLVLDIETSTLYNELQEPTAVWLSYGFCNLYNRDGNRVNKCYFREWEELRTYLNEVEQRFLGYKLLCYVHNLAYEFDFLIKNLSKPKTILANGSHAVISSILEDFPQIEFRCTFRLTMQPLRKIGEMVGLPKLDSDYRTITPLDNVSEEEVEYCCRDCDIVAQYIGKKLLPEYKQFHQTPLTKTGRVRKTYNKYYSEMVGECGEPEWDKLPPEDCYEALNNAFAGGICTSNPLFTGRILYNVQSYDITSSYPYAQLSELYPYSIEREYKPTKEMLQEPFWIAKIKFHNIKSRYNWGWLSVSKMNDFSPFQCSFFNGKLLWANYAVRTVTNVDYEMILQTYAFDDIEIEEFYHEYKYGELPYPYIQTIMQYAERKSALKEELKHIPENAPNRAEKEYEYLLAKGDFNSIYGMSVQKIMQVEYEVDDLFVWREKDKPYEQTDKHLKRNFLFGVYTTAYARKNLLQAILDNCPLTFVYCDTDSIKYIGDTPFTDTNKPLPDKYMKVPYLSKLGRFDKEHTYQSFITYGAKKYAHTYEGDGNVYLTVAGLPKKTANEYGIAKIEDFTIGKIFKACKLGKKYIYVNSTFELTDEQKIFNEQEQDKETVRYLKEHRIDTKGGVALFPVDYSLDITNVDIKIILRQERSLPQWLQTYKSLNGIDLTESCGTMLLTDSLSANGQTARLIALRNGLSTE